MPKGKRGQVTVFIAIGIVVLAVLILGIAFRGNISELVTEQSAEGATGFQAQADEVKEHIDNCLQNSLSRSVSELASKKVSDYEEQLGSEVTLRVGQCLNLESFTGITARKLEEPKLEIKTNAENDVITATLSIPITIEKEGSTEQLNEFVAQEKLQKKMCVLQDQLTGDCRAKQDITVGIFVFEEGQEVKIGGECLAC